MVVLKLIAQRFLAQLWRIELLPAIGALLLLAIFFAAVFLECRFIGSHWCTWRP